MLKDIKQRKTIHSSLRFNKRLSLLLLAVCIIGVLASCVHSPTPSSNPEEVSSETISSSEPEEFSEDPPPYGEPVTPSADILEKLSQSFPVGNPKGWLTIPGTTVDDAVLYSPENNDFYLDQRVNYQGKYDYSGLIFADFRNTLSSRVRLSRNTVIYGHNIETNGSINRRFSQLLKYHDLSFAKENQFVHFSTAEDEMVWQIFASFTTDTDFYYIEPDPTDDGFMYIISEAYQRSDHFYDVEVGPRDKILTLSTCTYEYKTFGVARDDQRYVVMAKLLSPDDDLVPVNVYENEHKKLPSFVK